MSERTAEDGGCYPIIEGPNHVGWICVGPHHLLHVEAEERSRWCFGCRRRVRYILELRGSREPSYYESTWSGRCPNGCGDRASGGFYELWWNA